MRQMHSLGTCLADVEGFLDGDLFIADTVWIVEGPVEEEPPVDTVST